ncbi:hypothetical protein KZ498_20815 [Haloarcula sp. 1CSR25-25]|nr:endonuclease/exonuclease/phosphatase family protein [Haloarcula sp. 1CSR25-25]MDT3437286.1 hypothetical protein [Haloarcula sp. 1CSR25-25]
MAFRNKKDQIIEHNPDILVVQECENPASKGDWSEFTDWRWIGDNEHKGLGVFTRNGLRIEAVQPRVDDCEYFLSVETSELDVVGVWAMNDEQNPAQRYIGQVYSFLKSHPEEVDKNTAVIGDFNWNIIWDESPNSSLCGDFSDVLGILNSHGLRSVYHELTDTTFGNEDTATFYMHKKAERPYHIDYAFLPEPLLRSVGELEIGEFDEWTEASDHMPLMVEIENTR